MSFTDHKITQFAHRVADLPDEPQIPAADLKSRFDACPEELRQSLNAVCDDAARLEARVEGIVVDTFGDTIDKEMLSDELAAELDGKATQSALSAEAAARESADDALEQALEQQIAQKCEIYCGTYMGNGQASQNIVLGFQPKAVLVVTFGGYNVERIWETGAQLATQQNASKMLQITTDGFCVSISNEGLNSTKDDYNPYFYIAFR